ncbi:MAG TPA: beta-galactosidase, partial [Bacteroidales bacterium]|nr:beta-galactosidase [Bacteroidales bacterium]
TFKDVVFQPGTIKAVGYDEKGTQVCEKEINTAGKPEGLKLSLINRPGGMLADGSDLALVQVEVVDKEGNRCPTALNMINFKVAGQGEYIGGIAQGPDNYIGASSLPVECGVNRIFIRSTDKEGSILIKATSKGLKSNSLTIKTRQSDVHALSDSLPGAHLPSYLAKGPTPTTSSYKISRIPVDIKSARAASNQNEARYSYDDNEMRQWHNDGSLETGIIEYELVREANINQVVMKLSGWRRRSYPIRVLVDNQEVYKGDTPRSLGYVTLTFPPVKGKKVRIELIGAASDNDAFKFRELSGKEDRAGLDDNKDRKGTLSIVEVEFYEPVANSAVNKQSL